MPKARDVSLTYFYVSFTCSCRLLSKTRNQAIPRAVRVASAFRATPTTSPTRARPSCVKRPAWEVLFVLLLLPNLETGTDQAVGLARPVPSRAKQLHDCAFLSRTCNAILLSRPLKVAAKPASIHRSSHCGRRLMLSCHASEETFISM